MLHNPTVGMRVKYRMTPVNPGFNGKIATITVVRPNEATSYRLGVRFDDAIGGKRDWNSGVYEYDPLIILPEEEAIYQAQQDAFKVAEAKRLAELKVIEIERLAELADKKRRQAHAMKYL